MRVVLVACPNWVALEGRYRAHIGLGPLSLAAVAQSAGHEVHLLDPNLLVDEAPHPHGAAFDAHVAARIAALAPEVVGFSTLSHAFAQVVRIAARLRTLTPAPIVFGGPHASVLDVSTLEAFPQVDMVLRGEAEQTFPMLLDALASPPVRPAAPRPCEDGIPASASLDTLADIPGLTWRDGGTLRRNPDAPLLGTLDDLPMPAYELAARAPGASLPIDVGRGCPYDCAFCSTCHFWKRRFRLKSTARIIEEIRTLRGRFGARVFDFPHDLFTADRRRVVAFCEALLAEGLDIAWTCFSRIDRTDDALLHLMRRAGCRAVGYGIETGSARVQRIVGKRLHLDRAREVVRATADAGMAAVLSFIVGFPEEEKEDVDATLRLMDELVARAGPSVCVGCSPLVPYAGSRYYRDHGGTLASWGYRAQRIGPFDADAMRTVRRHPRLFSDFTWIPHATFAHDELAELSELGTAMVEALPATWRLMLQTGQAPLDRWRAFRATHGGRYRSGAERGDSHRWLVEQFARWVRPQLPQGSGRALLDFELRLFRLRRAPAVPYPTTLPAAAFDLAARGALTPVSGVRLARWPLDVQQAQAEVLAGRDPSSRDASSFLLVPRGGLAEAIALPPAEADLWSRLPDAAAHELGADCVTRWLLAGLVKEKPARHEAHT